MQNQFAPHVLKMKMAKIVKCQFGTGQRVKLPDKTSIRCGLSTKVDVLLHQEHRSYLHSLKDRQTERERQKWKGRSFKSFGRDLYPISHAED